MVEEVAQQPPRHHRVALIACGALAQTAGAITARRGWPVDVHPLPPLLHNQPQQIAGEVRTLAQELLPAYDRVVVGYADCGTYGALDEVCRELGLERLPGLHCYDVYAGPSRLEAFFEEQPGTYLLTDFLVRSFSRTVVRELGLDRHPHPVGDQRRGDRADLLGDQLRLVVQQRRQRVHVDRPAAPRDDLGSRLGPGAAGDQGGGGGLRS